MEFRKKLKIRLFAAIGYMIIGAVLIALRLTGIKENNVINVFGSVFIIYGLVRFVQYMRIIKDESAIRSREIAETDERNIMLMEKARSVTFSVYIMAAGASMAVLYIFDMALAAQTVAYSICGFSFIYFISYNVIRKRY